MLAARFTPIAALTALLPSPAVADLIVVDAGGQGDALTIQDAVDAAQDGDLVYVRAGLYPQFHVDGKSIAIVGGTSLVGPSADVQLDGNVRVTGLAADQQVVLAGLSAVARTTGVLEEEAGLYAAGNAGVLLVLDGRFEGAGYPGSGLEQSGREGAWLEQNAHVSFVRTELVGAAGPYVYNCCDYGYEGGHGLYALGTQLALYDCVLRGGKGGESGWGGPGGAGCRVEDTGLFASGSSFVGGEGGLGFDFIYGPGGEGGPGLFLAASAVGELLDNVYEGGPGGESALTGPPGEPGEPTDGGGAFHFHAGTSRASDAPRVFWEALPMAARFDGEPDDLVWTVFGAEPDPRFQLAPLGVWLLDRAGHLAATPAGVAGFAGELRVELRTAYLGGQQARLELVQALHRDLAGATWLGAPFARLVLPCGLSEDCDGSGLADACEIADGLAPDCNANGVPDACDLAAATSADCDGNGVPDECDIAAGTHVDCDQDGVPDSCQLDCNGNGVADPCDVANGTSMDCDGDLLPDECELDCNANGVPDTCDIADGTSMDANGNGVPDECQTAGDVYYVDDDAAPLGDGSPAQPFDTLGAAVAYAIDGNTIVVLDGTYAGPGNRDLSIERALTIESANGPDACTLDGEDAGRAFTVQAGGLPVTLRGLTFRDGRAPELLPDGLPAGGALRVASGALTVEGCRFLDCDGGYRGGAIAVEGSASALTAVGCRFEGNRAALFASYEYGGGALFAGFGATALAADCDFVANRTSNPQADGGALLMRLADVTLEGCRFEANAARRGAAIAKFAGELRVARSTFADHDEGQLGTIFSDFGGDLRLAHCVLGGNDVGALFVDTYADLIALDHCLFTDNGSAAAVGGAIRYRNHSNAQAALRVSSCTFFLNTQTGGALSLDGIGSQTLVDSVLWGDPGDPAPILRIGRDLTVRYSVVMGGQAGVHVDGGAALTWGPGNLALYPSFQDPNGPDDDLTTWEDNDLRLSGSSPCIDAGDNAGVAPDALDVDMDGDVLEPTPLDLDLLPRFVDDPTRPDTGSGTPPVVDMGAYERP